MDEDGRDDGQDGQPVAAGPRIALLQEVRQRRHPRPDVERREEEGQDDEEESGHPLEVAVGQPVDVALLGQADEMDGRDVGREQGQADDRPAERAPGQEILGARGLLRPAPPPGPEPEADDADEVDGDDGQVQAGYERSGRRRSSCRPQSVWKTSSIRLQNSFSLRVGMGDWQGSVSLHHRCVSGSAAILAMSAARSSPVYSK